MEVLVFLVPMALTLGLIGLMGFLWSLKNGQYDDLEGAGGGRSPMKSQIAIDHPSEQSLFRPRHSSDYVERRLCTGKIAGFLAWVVTSLFSSTDPSQGRALVRSMPRVLRQRGVDAHHGRPPVAVASDWDDAGANRKWR